MAPEEVQVIEQGDLADNTEEQIANLVQMEALAEREKDWDRYKVVLTADEVDYVARDGFNLDDDGVPQPWRDTARCSVVLLAPSEDWAKMHALRHNPEYHTVESVEKVKT